MNVESKFYACGNIWHVQGWGLARWVGDRLTVSKWALEAHDFIHFFPFANYILNSWICSKEKKEKLDKKAEASKKGKRALVKKLAGEQMLQDHNKLLYPTCEDGQKKLGSTLELLKWKAETDVTDSGFEKLLVLMKKMIPRNNKLPANTYEAKKLVCPLGLDVQKIHTCPNDCIL